MHNGILGACVTVASCCIKLASQGWDYPLIANVCMLQISRPNMNDDDFLEEAVARYKGFLHLIKRNIDRSIHRFCVPTYDIDLIWHSHQLHPASYCEDLVAIMGKVLEHDDTDSNRAKGEKLDIGFSGTTKQWEDAFGLRYWKAGAMYRGHVPSALAVNLHQLNTTSMKVTPSNDYQTMFQLSKKTLVEVATNIIFYHFMFVFKAHVQDILPYYCCDKL